MTAQLKITNSRLYKTRYCTTTLKPYKRFFIPRSNLNVKNFLITCSMQTSSQSGFFYFRGNLHVSSRPLTEEIRLFQPTFHVVTKIRREKQKQPQATFRNIYRKTSMLESLFNKVAGLKTGKFIKQRVQNRCFPVTFLKFLRTSILKSSILNIYLELLKLLDWVPLHSGQP